MMQYDGILLCEKPYGATSHKVIHEMRQITGQKKIGHTGTLDPRATGLLVLCLGRATKISQFLGDLDKTYDAVVRLGQSSSTYDSEGVDMNAKPQPVPELTEKDILGLLGQFKGRIMQTVPPYSAVKVDGRRLYNLARKGKEFELPEKEVEIKEIRLTKLELPDLHLTIECSKGTYIRTLANDIGNKIGCGAYLASLVRTRVGQYRLQDATTLAQARHYRDAGVLAKYVKPIESVLAFPWLRVCKEFSPFILTGQVPRMKDISEVGGAFEVDELISLKDHNDKIVAVGRSDVRSSLLKKGTDNNFFRYVRVLN
ncbi:MAG: tRNA pseudouridine(55) synthase TruB [Candidatus Zixiibacteriota bacterium]